MNYKNGKIYQILNHKDNEIYIGSTCQPLSKRFSTHKTCLNNIIKQSYPLYIHMKKIGVENFYIELVEEYPCENIEQLRAREGHFIRERGTLNKAIAGRTQQEYGKEWRDNNREYAILKSKEWRNNNKELAILQSQKWRDTLDNKEKSQEYAKKYHQQHKETIRAKKNFKNNCVCGGQFTNANKIQHDKTKKHQEYINSLQN